MSVISITKRNGQKEPLNIAKIHRVVSWACEDIAGGSASELEIQSQLKFNNTMSRADIQETLIQAAANLISIESPGYQYVASRLINYHLRKQVYSQPHPGSLADLLRRNIKAGIYTPEYLEWYTDEEIDQIDSFINHDRDFSIAYAGMEQFRGKYLVKDRTTGQIFETPQMAYVLIAAALFHSYPKETRLKWVKDYYDATSRFDISLPTPIMAGLRTPQKQFSSCVLIDSDDSLDSIIATTGAVVKYVSKKAGIGINGGRIRAEKSKVRNGDTATTGPRGYWRLFQDATKSCSQGGVRGGAATLYWPAWHLDFEDLIVVKNGKGTEFNRIRQMDYGVQFNKLMYERLLSGGDITLFSPHEVPGMYEAFFKDQDKFKEIYEAAERSTKFRKKTIKASELFSMFMTERKETGRVYFMNVDHCNEHSSFITEMAAIYMSNLCTEITLPTIPLDDLKDPEGEIALCTLSANNLGRINKDFRGLEKIADLTVRGLDALLSYQDYPVPAAERATMYRRPLGIGLINLAYWMAKNDMTYSDPDLERIDELVEAWSYYLIKASVDLAEEFGPCPGWKETKYSLGITPNMTYKKSVDELVPHKERMPWRPLRERMQIVGIRNSTLMAQMPAETSAQTSNSTNGLNPVPDLVTVKKSKDGVLAQVVPEVARLKNKYELKWTMKSPQGYLKVMAVFQKYIDQAMSINTPYNPAFYENEEIPMSVLIGDMLFMYKYGLKTGYYFETHDGAGEEEAVPTETAVDEDEEECSACVL